MVLLAVVIALAIVVVAVVLVSTNGRNVMIIVVIGIVALVVGERGRSSGIRCYVINAWQLKGQFGQI